MSTYTIYDPSDGKIMAAGVCPDGSEAAQAPAGWSALIGAIGDAATQYVSGGAIVSRPLLTTVASWNKPTISANGTDQATLGSGLPNPTTISIIPPVGKGIASIPDQIVTTGSFSFTTTVLGDYVITAKAFPYQDYTVTIKARDAAAIAGSSASGALTTAIRLSGALSAQVQLAGELTTAIPLACAVSSASTATGALTTAIQLSGALNAQAQIAGALTTAIPLAASVSTTSTATGALSTSIRLAGALAGTSTMTGTLS